MGKGVIPVTIAATGQIVTGSGWLRKVIVTVTTADSAEARIYDNTAESGTTVMRFFAPYTATASYGISYCIDYPGAGVKFDTGLYGVCSGSVSSILAYYE